jgi:DNA-binding response OmpR family regulator
VITTVDINMPGIDGLEVTRRIRARSSTHIIVVSALTDEADAVLALSAGADDFVPKPFRAREFRARIDSVLRRARSGDAPVRTGDGAADEAPQRLTHGDLVLDEATRVAQRDGADVGLTRTEFDLLAALLRAGRRVLSRTDLVLVARGSRQDPAPVTDVDLRTIETHIANLRRKLGDESTYPRYVETVRGVGYRLTEAEPTQ